MAYEIPAYAISDNEKVAVDFYLACNTKIAALRLLRKLNGELRNLSPDGEKKSATKFFQKQYVLDYIEAKERELKAKYQTQQLVSDILEEENDEADLITSDGEARRRYLLNNYMKILKSPDATESDRIAANKAITDLLNAKEKEDETDNSAYSKYVHFVVPMQCCDNCQNRDNLLKDNNHFATEEEIEQAFYKR
ncbi:MAG: hypothetical protein IJ180_07635 [Bacteroidales bacterium]|nr:hypothetical protein [Bacteroidales bacterium]